MVYSAEAGSGVVGHDMVLLLIGNHSDCSCFLFHQAVAYCCLFANCFRQSCFRCCCLDCCCMTGKSLVSVVCGLGGATSCSGTGRCCCNTRCSWVVDCCNCCKLTFFFVSNRIRIP